MRDELNDLIDMLDQGEDAWAAKRSVERLIEQQRELQARTGEAAERTTGRSAAQLTDEEKRELEQLAQDQKSTAQQAAEAIRQMLERSDRLAKTDPAASQALNQAARRGQREQVAQTMERAAQQVQQNQTNSAQQQQAKAAQALEQMLGELDQAAKNRDEVLKRFLESLMDSIDGLIERQRNELAAIDAVMPDGPFVGLDAGMARLHASTLGVLEQAESGPREGAQVARLIERAADAQGASVVALRDAPINGEEARAQESISLDKLQEARELAGTLEEQADDREQARKAAELKQKYAEVLKRQIALRDQTLGMVGQEASRRTRAIARELGGEQAALRAETKQIHEGTSELSEAKMFDYAHRRLDELMGAAGDALADGQADAVVAARQESAARVLRSMIEALDNSKKKDQPFRENEQSQEGGGGQGKSPLVPPAAELKLLRALQEQTMELTRSIGQSPDDQREVLSDDAAKLQRELAEQGKELLERVSKNAQGGGGGGGRARPVEVRPVEPGDGGGGEGQEGAG